MKKSFKFFTVLSGAALLASSHLTAESVSTNPVGYRSTALPSGNIPFAPSFVHAVSYTAQAGGIAENADSSTVTLIDGAMPVGVYDESAMYPVYYLEITEAGSDQGYVFDVISNTATTVTVAGLLTSDFSLGGDESVAIRKHMTIGDVFQGAAIKAYADSVKFFNEDGSDSLFFWDGLMWTPDFVENHSDRPVYPGHGFMVTLAAPVDLTITGAVKTTATKVPVYAGVINFIASLAPADSSLGELGFVSVLQAYADSVKTFSQDGMLNVDGLYYSDGVKMTKDFSSDNGSDEIKGDNSFLVTVSGDMYISLPAAYSN
jgi:hypothetical protein